MDRRSFVRATVAAVGLGLGAPAVAAVAAPDAVVSSRGGSNYGWYRLDGCTREPFGVVNTFDQQAGLVRGQLQAMYRAGQRRLRVLVYHRRGPDTGTLMDSTGGDLSARNRGNLRDLLAAIRATGFEEIQVAFLPSGQNSPATWTTFSEDLYRENQQLITNLRPLLTASRLAYRIDLSNEAIPAPGQAPLLEYARRLWTDYSSAFGRDDTIGFSIIADPERIRRLPEVYGDRPPRAFDFHVYPVPSADEYQRFVTADDLMRSMGYAAQPWTIGEAHYDDDVAAANLQRAVTDTGRTVRYLLQWPLTRRPTCSDVDVAPPVSFGRYLDRGF